MAAPKEIVRGIPADEYVNNFADIITMENEGILSIEDEEEGVTYSPTQLFAFSHHEMCRTCTCYFPQRHLIDADATINLYALAKEAASFSSEKIRVRKEHSHIILRFMSTLESAVRSAISFNRGQGRETIIARRHYTANVYKFCVMCAVIIRGALLDFIDEHGPPTLKEPAEDA